MLKRYDRALLIEAGVPFLAVLGLSLGLLVANRMFKVLPWLFDLKIPFSTVGGLLLWLVPSFVVYAVPIATWIAWMLAYGRMGTDGELTAWASVGASPWRLVRPAATVGLLLAAIAIAVAQWGYGHGRRAFAEGMSVLAQQTALSALQPGALLHLGESIWIGVAEHGGIYVVRDPDVVIAAAGARPLQEKLGLELDNGIAFARASSDPAFAMFAGGSVRFWDASGPPPRLGPREMTLAQLWQKRHLHHHRTELHQRLALAASALLAPLAAFLAAPRRSRSARGGALLAAMIGLGVYYTLFTIGKQGAMGKMVPAGLGIWMANLALATAVAWGMWRRGHREGLP